MTTAISLFSQEAATFLVQSLGLPLCWVVLLEDQVIATEIKEDREPWPIDKK